MSESKRSRFDRTEAEPKKSSRFDRRSRSPGHTTKDRNRSRSPGKNGHASPSQAESKAPSAAAQAAAAAAAKINAQIQAKKGPQHVDVPPIVAVSVPDSVKSPSTTTTSITTAIKGEVYIADGDYIQDIEVNDLRNRYTLTKGATQKMIKDETGADVTTRGNYYPDKSMATAANPPLYLHVTSVSKSGLEAAVAKINELMQQELPNLIDERRFRRREPDQVERDEFGRRKWPEERIEIGLEPIPGFNLRAQVVGHGGSYVKHIQQETRCRVQIKGRGSGFVEQTTGQESDEPMYLHVAGPDAAEVQRAKALCEDLLNNVRDQYQKFKENPPQRNFGGGGYGGDRQNQGNSGYNSSYGYGGYGGGQSSVQSPAPGTSAMSPGGAANGQSTDYSAQWAQYYQMYPEAAQQYYQQYMQQYQASAAAATPPPPPAGQAPPGASSEQPPPPPPPASSPPGYSSVPPPPGL